MTKAKKSKIVVDTTNTKIDEDEIAKSFAAFLKPSDLNHGDVLTITSPAYLAKTKYGAKRHVEVKLADGSVGLLRLNRISLANLVKAFGSDSSNWVGKKVVVKKTVVLDKDTVVVDKA
jgi:hypothetical protein